MRLLRADTEELIFETVHDESKPYAILSHRWLAEDQEVKFADIVSKTDGIRSRDGWKKLDWCRQQAAKDGYRYVWADTACIDKSSSQELTESINSMYRWYQKAEVCYVYLHDVDASQTNETGDSRNVVEQPVKPEIRVALEHDSGVPLVHHDLSPVERQILQPDESARPFNASTMPLDRQQMRKFRKLLEASVWFTRAWTLQELIAPTDVQFYDASCTYIGNVQEMANIVAEITGVHKEVLTKQRPLAAYSIAQKMSWAAKRCCTKIEDEAYSLLGIMGVSMGVVYGEGHYAFQRLQEQLLHGSSDDSIFAFDRTGAVTEIERYISLTNKGLKVKGTSLLAASVRDFQGCGDVISIQHDDLLESHQLSGKEVRFQGILLGKRRLIFPLESFLLLWHWAIRSSPVHFGDSCEVVLKSYREQALSKIITLKLAALDKNTYVVSARGARTGMHSIYEYQDHRYGRTKFSIVLNPNNTVASPPTLHTIVYEIKTNGLTLQLVHSSIAYSFNTKEKAFTFPAREYFRAELIIAFNGSAAATMHLYRPAGSFLRMDWSPILVNFDTPPRYPGDFGVATEMLWFSFAPYLIAVSWIHLQSFVFHLPCWSTFILMSSHYDCTLKWSRNGIFVARVYSDKQPIGRRHVAILEIERYGFVRFIGFILFRILLWAIPWVPSAMYLAAISPWPKIMLESLVGALMLMFLIHHILLTRYAVLVT